MTPIENANEVLCALGRAALPHQFCIAGGFARDLFYGVTPKDIDVVIVGQPDMYAIEDALKQAGYILTRSDGSEGVSGGDAVWTEVHQFEHPYKLSIDLLFSAQETVLDAIDTFDCNLNQFMLRNGAPIYLGGSNAVLKFMGASVSADRRAYIQDKARNLGWVVPIAPEEVK